MVRSGLLDLPFQEKDSIMADKGFTIHDGRQLKTAKESNYEKRCFHVVKGFDNFIYGSPLFQLFAQGVSTTG